MQTRVLATLMHGLPAVITAIDRHTYNMEAVALLVYLAQNLYGIGLKLRAAAHIALCECKTLCVRTAREPVRVRMLIRIADQ